MRDQEDRVRAEVVRNRAGWVVFRDLPVARAQRAVQPIHRAANNRATLSSTLVRSTMPPTGNTRPSTCPVSIQATTVALWCAPSEDPRSIRGIRISTASPVLSSSTRQSRKNLVPNPDRLKSIAKLRNVKSSNNNNRLRAPPSLQQRKRSMRSNGSMVRASTNRACLLLIVCR